VPRKCFSAALMNHFFILLQEFLSCFKKFSLIARKKLLCQEKKCGKKLFCHHIKKTFSWLKKKQKKNISMSDIR